MTAYVQALRSDLTTLFLIAVLGIALTLSIPVSFPHTMHGFHADHILLYMGGMILALFITTLAAVSYRTLRSRRLLLTTVAFANFMLAEMLLLAHALRPDVFYIGKVHISEIGHLLTFVTLGLLALGVLSND